MGNPHKPPPPTHSETSEIKQQRSAFLDYSGFSVLCGSGASLAAFSFWGACSNENL